MSFSTSCIKNFFFLYLYCSIFIMTHAKSNFKMEIEWHIFCRAESPQNGSAGIQQENVWFCSINYKVLH